MNKQRRKYINISIFLIMTLALVAFLSMEWPAFFILAFVVPGSLLAVIFSGGKTLVGNIAVSIIGGAVYAYLWVSYKKINLFFPESAPPSHAVMMLGLAFAATVYVGIIAYLCELARLRANDN